MAGDINSLNLLVKIFLPGGGGGGGFNIINPLATPLDMPWVCDCGLSWFYSLVLV